MSGQECGCAAAPLQPGLRPLPDYGGNGLPESIRNYVRAGQILDDHLGGKISHAEAHSWAMENHAECVLYYVEHGRLPERGTHGRGDT